MIPTLIVAGWIIGLIPTHWHGHRGMRVALVAMLVIAWGLLVEVPVGGTALAFANLLVGLGAGLGAQLLLRGVIGRTSGTS